MDYSLIGSSVHGIFRQGYWLPFPPPWDLPDPGIKPMYLMSPALADRFFTTTPPGKSHIVGTMQKKKAENKADFCTIQLRDRNSITYAKTYSHIATVQITLPLNIIQPHLYILIARIKVSFPPVESIISSFRERQRNLVTSGFLEKSGCLIS